MSYSLTTYQDYSPVQRVLASLLAHKWDEAGTRLQDHDEVRARTVPQEGPPALENYLAYPTLPTTGSARPLLLPRQQTTPRHSGISLGDAAARQVRPAQRDVQDTGVGAKTNRTTPRHNGISPGDGVSNERAIRRRADHDTWK